MRHFFPAVVLGSFTVALASFSVETRAQPPQERGLMERIQRPDLSLAYHPAEKRFGGGAGATPWKKGAPARTFPSGRRATVKPYGAKGFSGSRGFASGTFADRDRVAAVNVPAAGADRTFATRDVDVREARDARKALPIRAARVPNFTPVGKRQDTLDEQQRTHPMTIDEVRELLNKSR